MSTTAEIVIDTVLEWGVQIIFGIPGDGINGLMEAIRERQAEKKLRFIQVRHEEAAALMAWAMPNSRESWVAAWRLQVPAASIC